ncbi:glycosyltransferase family 4 protein [Aurantimonas endophytica]|uniref:Glycosyltransferase involved in cell wall biosynthesis n=1 Tax=Aurantimonas endophytica TaxID=1522175 RepID=A0A7W6HCP9_9HYPH|nr:glycosyltransferase family 4 protein [Aurantimonas endophytica]MBB4002756.1 glycosyltransferase involved in cell wall biosynthesis [Aurantimonas endophytica]MCO6403634.1 glycosyltransferase [Aurantimonas endophytica]
MTRPLVFAIPGDIETRSGGYGYDRRMLTELGGLGWNVTHLALPGSFPAPTESDLAATEAAFAAIPDRTTVLIDGLAFGTMPDIARAEAGRLRLVALVHHPLALEAGLSADQRDRLERSERSALGFAKAVVVTSPATASELVANWGVPAERLTVVLPGTDAAPRATSSDGAPVILAIGTLIPRKDHATLVAALARLAHRDWRCRIVGGMDADPATTAALRDQIAASGLADRIELAGALPDVAPEYQRADIFALASRYEGYGMVFAEAMANGLPIVACRAGAVGDVVPEAAGILVPPGDVTAFADALGRLLVDADLRTTMAAASHAAGQKLPSWRQSAATLSAALEGVAR